MKRLTLASLFFAALFGASAQAQIITNYGDATYGAGSNWSGGTWDGSSGRNISSSAAIGRWAAQTFTAPAAIGATIYAYNFQLNVVGAAPTFTASIYEWAAGSTVGAPLAGTTTSFTVTSSGFGLYGLNLVTNPGYGVSLTPGATYALVLNRTDIGTTGLVQYGYDDTGSVNPGTGEYTGGGAYRSLDGTTYTSIGAGNDMAFWISFDPNSLSPVPEPAVNGAIIGGVFVLGLVGYRRYGRKASAAPVDASVAV